MRIARSVPGSRSSPRRCSVWIVILPAHTTRLGSQEAADAVYWTVREAGAAVGGAGEQPARSTIRTISRSCAGRMPLPFTQEGNKQINPLLQAVLENEFAFGMIPFAGRPQPIQDRDAQGGDLVSVRGAPRPAGFEVHSYFLGNGFGLRVRVLHGFVKRHGRMFETARYLDRGPLQDRLKGLNRGENAFGLAWLQHAQVHFCGGLFRYHVRSRSSADHADVERGASAVVGQLLDGHHLMGQLLDRIASFLVVGTGMGGSAVDGDGELTDALAPGFNGSVRQTWFEHQDQDGLFCQAFDQCLRGVTADLLIGGE